MSEGNRRSRRSPQGFEGANVDNSSFKEPRVDVSEATQSQSSRRAAQAQPSPSQTASAKDQEAHGLQAAQTALSALRLSTSSGPTVERSGIAKSTSSSSHTQVAANFPPRAPRPQNPISQKWGSALSGESPTSTSGSATQEAAELQRLPGAKSLSTEKPRSVSERIGPQLMQSIRSSPSAARAAQGDPAPQERSTSQGRPGNSLGLPVPQLANNETSKRPLTVPALKEKPTPQVSGRTAPHSVGAAGPSSSRTLKRGLGRGAASSTERVSQVASAAPSATTRQTRQSNAVESFRVGRTTAVSNDAEANTSEVSHASL